MTTGSRSSLDALAYERPLCANTRCPHNDANHPKLTLLFLQATPPPAFGQEVGGAFQPSAISALTAILGFTLFAALAMSAATASGFEI
jgi:hypothetical protein